MNALILVDVQNDFAPGGALAVNGGDLIVPVINLLQPQFDLIVATQDWHPREHGSFAANHPGRQPGEIITLDGLEQVLWPVHCVKDTPGAEFVPTLQRDRWSCIFHKGTDPVVDSYSGFFDNGHRRSTGLGDYLRERGAETVFIAGLATDYCVKFTALDALNLGFKTCLIEDACRGVNLQPDDSAKAIAEIRQAGASILSSGDLVRG